MDSIDKQLINSLQRGLPVCDEPFADIAAELNMDTEGVLQRIERLKAQKYLTRFGPMFHAEKLGGGLTLAAMEVEPAAFDTIAAIVNSFEEVAHNYQRDHPLNMWFVLATETPQQIDRIIAAIEKKTGLPVYNMPKQEEFYVGLYFAL